MRSRWEWSGQTHSGTKFQMPKSTELFRSEALTSRRRMLLLIRYEVKPVALQSWIGRGGINLGNPPCRRFPNLPYRRLPSRQSFGSFSQKNRGGKMENGFGMMNTGALRGEEGKVLKGGEISVTIDSRSSRSPLLASF